MLGWMLGGFALLGLQLAALGLYGVISGLVVQRTREIGLRMALGAQVRDVIRLVIGQGSRLAVIGTLIGIGGAFALGRLLRSIAPELLTHDPLIVAFVAALLLAVAMVACWLPARRAAKVDPLVALRSE